MGNNERLSAVDPSPRSALPKEKTGPTSTATKIPFFTLTTFIAVITALGIVAYLMTYYLLHLPISQCRWILISVLAAGGGPLVFALTRKAFAGEFGSDLLAGMSIVTSAVLGEYLAGSIVVLMLSGGTALEEYATRRASSVLAALAKRCRAWLTARKMNKYLMSTLRTFS